jgi:hypothetical protein
MIPSRLFVVVILVGSIVSSELGGSFRLADPDLAVMATPWPAGSVTDPIEVDGVPLAPAPPGLAPPRAPAPERGAPPESIGPSVNGGSLPVAGIETRYRISEYTIRALPPGSLPYVDTILPSLKPPSVHDGKGVPMKIVAGKRYYSPAGGAQYGLRMEDAYRRSQQPGYLQLADRVLRTLIATGVASNGGIYVPYWFDFRLHQDPREVMRAPWYSAMAQGLLLSLAVRLHRDTGDPWYLDTANSLFATFHHIGRGSAPWVTMIDARRYYWLEEYPEPRGPADHTLNGFNFAVFGLYDYYQETGSPDGLHALRGALTTLRHNVASYRVPGSFSRYCLEHGHPLIGYHRIVTWQLVFMAQISGDQYFLAMSRLFRRDCA